MTNQEDPAEAARAAFVADLGRAESGWPKLLGRWSVLSPHLSGQVSVRSADQPALNGPVARRLLLADGWQFTAGVPQGWDRPGVDTTGWEEVVIPHCVAPLSWRDWDPATWEREFCYRREFVVGTEFDGLRVFLDFSGVMTKATVHLNGVELGIHLGGYLPFSYEITDVLHAGVNELSVLVDGSFTLNVPPNSPTGTNPDVDYHQPAGIYRDVVVRGVPQLFVDDVFAKPVDVLSDAPYVRVQATVDAATQMTGSGLVTVEILDPDDATIIGSGSGRLDRLDGGRSVAEFDVRDLRPLRLWDVDSPQLYTVVTTLVWNGQALAEHRTRIGFREARFAKDGFFLNGHRRTVMGLNRHQLFPFAGFAMPDRVQRRDAEIIRRDLNCTMVRCSHYPQSPAFLDACDELGLMVWEEPAGWQYLGDAEWKELACRDVTEMIIRDRNRPAVVLWAPRLNETADDTELWSRTEAIAKSLDDSRQTAAATHGEFYFTDDYQHDVFGYDDYTIYAEAGDHFPHLLPPRTDRPYLISESITWRSSPTQLYRRIDSPAVQRHQAVAHAIAHEKVARDDRYTGLLAWSGIDYQSGIKTGFDGVKYSGVLDVFRVPKLGAAIYRAQVDPLIRPVIEPVFFFDLGEHSPAGPGADAMICSNCDRLELFLDDRHLGTALPDRERFGHLRYPPSFFDITVAAGELPDLRIDGYVGAREVLRRSFAADPAGDGLHAWADDTDLAADGVDGTRVVVAVTDRFGNIRPFGTGQLTFDIEGPGHLVGESKFAFGDAGGVAAVWLRGIPGRPGLVRLLVRHDALGEAVATVAMRPR